MQVTEQRYYTPEEYLALEEAADYKSEYIDGQIFHKAGESTNHNLIAGNLSAALNFAFKTQEYEGKIIKFCRGGFYDYLLGYTQM